jgi:hypothetical protein
MHKAKILVPTVLGALGGVYLVLFPMSWIFVATVIVMVVLLGVLVGVYRYFERWPRTCAAILNLWILFLPVITSLAVCFMLWATIRVEAKSIAPLPGWTAGQMADLVKYLVGIITGLAVAVVSNDPEENIFWPDFQFKRVAGKAVQVSSQEDPVRYYAAHMPATNDNKGKGWGFRSRRIRARYIALGESGLLTGPKTAGAPSTARRRHDRRDKDGAALDSDATK